ncbi:MAG: ABC transporter permease [Anaerolineales bacterium]
MTTIPERSTGLTREQAQAALQHARPELVANKLARWNTQLSTLTLNLYGIFGYLFLYLPIVLVVLFSFNAGRSTAQWDGFSLRWYGEMFSDAQLILSLWNSLFVAGVSALLSTVFGTLAALGMERYRFRGKFAMDALLYLPIVIPDIAMAIMLLVFFNLSGIGFEPWRLNLFGVNFAVPFSVIIGHVAFSISFVVVIVRARLHNMERTLEEAAHDLYANNWHTFWRITLPLLMPGILGGALLAFTLSLDDFVITFFTSGAGFNTLPMYVFGLIKRGVSPKINAISTLMLFGSLILVGISLLARRINQSADEESAMPLDF